MFKKIAAYLSKLWRDDPFSDPDKDGYFDSGMWEADRKRREEAKLAEQKGMQQ